MKTFKFTNKQRQYLIDGLERSIEAEEEIIRYWGTNSTQGHDAEVRQNEMKVIITELIVTEADTKIDDEFDEIMMFDGFTSKQLNDMNESEIKNIATYRDNLRKGKANMSSIIPSTLKQYEDFFYPDELEEAATDEDLQYDLFWNLLSEKGETFCKLSWDSGAMAGESWIKKIGDYFYMYDEEELHGAYKSLDKALNDTSSCRYISDAVTNIDIKKDVDEVDWIVAAEDGHSFTINTIDYVVEKGKSVKIDSSNDSSEYYEETRKRNDLSYDAMKQRMIEIDYTLKRKGLEIPYLLYNMQQLQGRGSTALDAYLEAIDYYPGMVEEALVFGEEVLKILDTVDIEDKEFQEFLSVSTREVIEMYMGYLSWTTGAGKKEK